MYKNFSWQKWQKWQKFCHFCHFCQCKKIDIRSRPAGHIGKGGYFSSKPNGFRIKRAYRSFYASINAPYAHLIHKISFY